MAERKARAGSFKYSPIGLRRVTNQKKRDLASGRAKPKDMSVPTTGGLAARLAAQRAAKAASGNPAAQPPAQPAQPARPAWVTRAQQKALPPKSFASGVAGGSPANQKKKVVKMPKPVTKATRARRRVI